MNIHHDAARYLADQAAKKCRYHDVRLDPDTGWCYLCTCPKCDGAGTVIRYSPHGRNDPSLEDGCDCGGAAFLPAVSCEQCRRDLDHDDPTWVTVIIDGQHYPLCAECAERQKYAPQGVR